MPLIETWQRHKKLLPDFSTNNYASPSMKLVWKENSALQ